MQLRRTQTEVIGVVLFSLTNQKPQTPERHSPTFATFNKTTLLATVCTSLLQPEHSAAYSVSDGGYLAYLLIYRFDDSNLENLTNPVMISSLKVFIALIWVLEKPANQKGSDFHIVLVSFCV